MNPIVCHLPQTSDFRHTTNYGLFMKHETVEKTLFYFCNLHFNTSRQL